MVPKGTLTQGGAGRRIGAQSGQDCHHSCCFCCCCCCTLQVCVASAAVPQQQGHLHLAPLQQEQLQPDNNSNSRRCVCLRAEVGGGGSSASILQPCGVFIFPQKGGRLLKCAAALLRCCAVALVVCPCRARLLGLPPREPPARADAAEQPQDTRPTGAWRRG